MTDNKYTLVPAGVMLVSSANTPNMSADEVLAVLSDCMSHALHSRLTAKQVDALYCARTAVAALIEREAALVAELANIRRMAEQAAQEYVDHRRANETERDALAAEVKALREDAERWQEVARRYDASTTSRAVMVLQGLGLEETPYRSFAENIDAARASAATTKENETADEAKSAANFWNAAAAVGISPANPGSATTLTFTPRDDAKENGNDKID